MLRHRSFVLALALSLCQWSMPSQGFCQQQAITNGLTWLSSVQQTNGSWGDWSAPVVRNTAIVAEAFQALAPASPSYTAALQWLANED